METGFEPLSVSRHGPLPILTKTPEYFGPRGVTKLQIYGGRRPYLMTYFSDGSGIMSSQKPGENANTTYLQLSGDFGLDYQSHIAAVERRIRTDSVSPLYVADVKALRALYRLFPVFMISDSTAAKFLMTNLAIVIGSCSAYGRSPGSLLWTRLERSKQTAPFWRCVGAARFLCKRSLGGRTTAEVWPRAGG